MLKPYICVACEKVILAADGAASLISLFSKIVIGVPVATEIPRNAVAPKEWAVFSIWCPEQGDELKNFEICTQFIYPDLTQFGDIVRHQINVEQGKRAQVLVQVPGFPIGQVGPYTVRTWIEEGGKKVSEPIEFKIELEIATADQTKPSETAVKA